MRNKGNGKIWKRGLAALLVVVLTICMLPFTGNLTVHAAGYAGVFPGTAGVQAKDLIVFGSDHECPAYTVLDTKANGTVPSDGNVLFLTKPTNDSGKYAYSTAGYQWASSYAKQRCEERYKDQTVYSALEQNLILPTTKPVDSAELEYSTTDALNGDHIFFLSRSEFGKYRSITPQSTTRSWFRSGFKSSEGTNFAFGIDSNGMMLTATVDTSGANGLSDVYCLNLNGSTATVLYSCDKGDKERVVGGDGTLLTNNWHSNRITMRTLTILDPKIQLKAKTSYDKANRTVNVQDIDITGAEGAVLTAMVSDGVYNDTNSKISYYSKINVSGTTASFKLPEDVPDDAHVYIIAEKRNGEYRSDAAGVPVEVDITQNTVFTINTSVMPTLGGTVTPPKTVVQGENVTLTANPAEGYAFSYWRTPTDDAVISTTPTMTVTNVQADETYVAVFEKSSYKITATASPKEGGIVSGGGSVLSGGTVTLRATPESNYTFKGWYKDGRLAGTDSMLAINNVDADATYMAVFEKTNYTMTLAMFPAAVGRTTITDDPLNWADVTLGNSAITTKVVTPGKKYHPIGQRRSNLGYQFVGFYYEDGALFSNEEVSHDVGYNGEAYWQNATKNSVEAKARDDVYYIRYKLGTSADYTLGVTTIAFPAEGGVTSGDKDSNTAFTTTIKATPNTGYAFDHWEWTKNGTTNTSTKESMEVSCTGYEVYKAYFRKATYEITAEASPKEGGVIEGTGSYLYDTSAVLKAYPADNYHFTKWTWKDKDGNECESSSTSITVENIKAACHYKAVFERDNYQIRATANDFAAGNLVKIKIGTNTITSTNTNGSIYSDVTSGGTAVLTAEPANGYSFKRWVANDGTTSTTNPLNVDNIKEDKEYRAEFAKTTYDVTLKQTPANGGTVKFVKDESSVSDVLQIGGTRTYEAGSNVYIYADTASNMKFYRWEGSDGSYYYYQVMEIPNIQSDVTFTAVFTTEKVTIKSAANPTTAGSVTINGNTSNSVEVNSRSNVTLKATADSTTNYKFVKWMDSKGNSYTDNPLYLVNVLTDETYTAIFEIPSYKITTLSNPIDGGTVTGGGTFGPNDTTTLIATPAADYTFDYWECSDGTKSKGTADGTTNKLELKGISSDATYTAHFLKQNLDMTIFWTPVGGTSRKVTYMYTDIHTETDLVNGETLHDIPAGSNIALTATPDPGEKFKQWVAEDGTVVTENPMTLVNIKKDIYYTAQFVPDSYKIKVVSTPVQGGSVGGGGDVAAGGSISLNAVPNSDYVFDYWSCDDGTTAAGTPHDDGSNTLTLNGVYGDATYTAHFLEENCTITVRWTPVTDSTNKVVYSTMVNNVEHDLTNNGSFTVGAKTDAILRAVPGDGYKFKQWVKEDGTVISTNPLILSNIEKSATYIATFELLGYTIKTASLPADGGSTSGGGDVAAGGHVTLVARPNEGYEFDYWSCDDGTEKTGEMQADGTNKLEVTGIYGDATYTAHFIKQICTVTVRWTPVTDGANKVVYSLMVNNVEHDLENNGSFQVGVKTGATLRAVPGTGYRFKRWIKEDGTTVDGTSTLILSNITKDAVYIAEFEYNAYTITTKSAPADGGSTSGGGAFSAGSTTTLTATPNEGYVFDCWKDDSGNKYDNEVLELKEIYSDATYTAYFKKSEDAITLVASPASGGTVTKKVNADGTITIKASANKGYIYKRWKKGDTELTTSTTYKVTAVTEKATYTAYFEVDSNYSAKSGITDEKFQNTRRLFKEPNYKNTKETMAAFASSFIAGTMPQYDIVGHTTKAAVTAAKNRMEANTASEDIILSDSELVTTENEIIPVTLLSDTAAILDEAKQITAQKFGNRYETTLLRVCDVTPPDNFTDGTRTLIWQGTNAAYKDNVYIIWTQPGAKQQIITGIIDEQGMIKFTVPGLGSAGTTTRVCAVKVTIE